MHKHNLVRVAREVDGDGCTRWRWVCACTTSTGRNRTGQWNYQSENVAAFAHRKHAETKGKKDT